jgi:hypothetical protein
MSITVSLATFVVFVLFCGSIVFSFFLYRTDLWHHAKVLKDIIRSLEEMVKDRETTIADMQSRFMAKDLTDYKVNTQVTQSTEGFVQTEPNEMNLEQTNMEDFLKAIKEAPAETTESGQSAEPVSQ